MIFISQLRSMAPEVYREYKSQKHNGEKYITIDYTKQPSWELGIITHLIITNVHPFENYPKNNELDFNKQSLIDLKISDNIIQKISQLLEKDGKERINLTLF